MNVCQNCGTPTVAGQTHCAKCGHLVGDLPVGAKPPPIGDPQPDFYCTTCGMALRPGPAFCPNCGAPLPREWSDGVTRPKPGSVALQVIAILLFIVVGLPAAALGGCVLRMGGASEGGGDAILFGLGGLILAALLLWLMIYAVRKKK